jgi:hypothetical protein
VDENTTFNLNDNLFSQVDPRFHLTTAGGWARSATAPLQQNPPSDGANRTIPATLRPDRSPEPDPKAAREFLQKLGDDHVLCCIHPERGDIRPLRGVDAIKKAFELNARGYNVYYAANKVASGVVKKPSKQEIETIRAVYGDIDWDRFKFEGRFPEALAELDITAEQLKSMTPPATTIVFTGGGLQPIWRTEALPNTPENVGRVEALGEYIERRFGGDPVGEISRILRLPGTVNRPKKEKRDAGQTTAVAAVVYESGVTYELEDLETAWPVSAIIARTPRSRLPASRSTPADPPLEPLEESSLAAGTDYDDLGAGVAETAIEDLRYYGLIVASLPNGPFSSRKEWTDPASGDKFSWLDLLFVASDLADEYPENETKIRAVFDEVCERAGGNTSGNDTQWEAQAGQSGRRRAAGKPVTTMGTLIRLAEIVEPLSLPSPHAASLPTSSETSVTLIDFVELSLPSPHPSALPASSPGAETTNSQPPERPDDGEDKSTPDAAAPSKILTPHRRFGDPRPPLSVRTIIDVDKNPPPRQWALGVIASYGSVTTIAAPGGSGKTAFGIILALEGASGHNLIGHKIFLGPQRTLFFTQEETTEEIERRLLAAMRHHNIPQPCFGNILFRALDPKTHEEDERIELISMKDNIAVVNKDGIAKLGNLINDFDPRIVILDPLNSLLAAGLNENLVMTSMITRLRTLRTPSPVAIILLHHTRKGGDLETQDATMGAAAIVNASRTALTLQKLNGKDAEQLGIPPSVAPNYFRVNHVKMNYAKHPEDEDIYQLGSVNLGNATLDYPAGDDVGVVIRFDPAGVPRAKADPKRDLIALRLIHDAPANELLGISKQGSANRRNVHAHIQKGFRADGINIHRKNVETDAWPRPHSRGQVQECGQ